MWPAVSKAPKPGWIFIGFAVKSGKEISIKCILIDDQPTPCFLRARVRDLAAVLSVKDAQNHVSFCFHEAYVLENA